VIGGGDWSPDRLIPDAVRAVHGGAAVRLRYPQAVRPWQHVLDSLSGYLLLGQRLLERARGSTGPWNFGPLPQDTCTVGELLDRLRAQWPAVRWEDASDGQQPH